MDGANKGTKTLTCNWETQYTSAIGRNNGEGNAYFNGKLSEVRFSSILRADAWELTCFNNQNSPTTFAVIGALVGESSEISYDYDDISGWDADTDVTAAELEELTDASETALHSHAAPALDYSDISTNDAGTDISAAELEALTDAGVTVLHSHPVWHGYGGFEDQAEIVACGVGDWNHITNVGNDLWSLDEGDGLTEAADVFTITNPGDYAGVLSLSLSALNGKDYHVRVYNNTLPGVMGRPIGISATGAGNEMNVCVPIYIEAAALDAIQFEIMSADGTDPTIDDALFYFNFLHS